MVIIVVIIFAVCWLPIQIILVLQKFGVYPVVEVPFIGLQMASNCLAYMNSCVNPFLYASCPTTSGGAFANFSVALLHPHVGWDYERTNIRYNDKDTKNTNLSRSANMW